MRRMASLAAFASTKPQEREQPKLDPMKASSLSRPAWPSAAMALRVNRHSSP
jgi:hypothetical protein